MNMERLNPRLVAAARAAAAEAVLARVGANVKMERLKPRCCDASCSHSARAELQRSRVVIC